MCQCERLHVDQTGPIGAEIARLAWLGLRELERRNGGLPDLNEGVISLLKLLAASAHGPAAPADFEVPVPVAARLLGVSERHIRRLALAGKLQGARTVGRDPIWLIPRSAIESRRVRRAAA
jgi:excisionase family DNA binding protein